MSWWVSIEREVTTHDDCSDCKGHAQGIDFEVNITFNVSRMLMRAGIHPKVLNGMTVEEALPIIKNGYALLDDLLVYFKQFDAVNNWVTVRSTIDAMRELLNALEHGAHPDDKVRWV